MKNIFKIEYDEKNEVKWDTIQQRFAFAFEVVSFLVVVPILFFSFAWVFYWIFTGKNMFSKWF